MHPPPAVKMAPNAPRRHPGPGVPRQQQQVQGPQQLQGPQTAAGHSHPAVVSLKKEIGVALDASQPLAARCSSLGKLHAIMSSHQANRPGVAVAMLPLFLASWPQLMACLWDPATPQLAAAAAPLLGIVGALVTSSRALAAAADAAAAAAAVAAAHAHTTDPAAAGTGAPATAVPAASTHGPPPPPSSLLFDWLLPLLTGAVPLPTGAPTPAQLQALLCKTLAYALQQLPSCSTAADAVQRQHPAPQAAVDAASTSQAPTRIVPTSQLQARAGQQQQQGAKAAAATATAAAGGAGSTPAVQEKLLTAPVPHAAAELLQQHAAAVMAAVQQLLEAVSTPPELLGPLLQLLLEVIRLAHVVVTGAVLRDLVDLLLGWSLEPGLQAIDRQLITRVLTALKPSWQSEPQLAHDVAGKLLVDLQHLLPAPPPTVAAAAAAAAQSPLPAAAAGAAAATVPRACASAAVDAAPASTPTDANAERQSNEPQLQEQLQKLLALLSCLVAIVKATYDTPGQQQLMAKALRFVEAAHGRVAAHAAPAAAGSAPPSSTWSSAAASLASSMLALWEAVVGQPVKPEASDATASAAKGASESTDRTQNTTLDQSSASNTAPVEAGAVHAQQQAGGSGALTAGTAVAAVDASAVSEHCWALVLATLQLPLLAAEDAVGLLGSINRGLAVAVDAIVLGSSSSRDVGSAGVGAAVAADAKDTSSVPHVEPGNEQQQEEEGAVDAVLAGQVSGRGVVPEKLPLDLWSVTTVYRCSPLADVQAAAAATYTAAVLLSDAHASTHSNTDGSNAGGSSAGGSNGATNVVIQAIIGEVLAVCDSLAHRKAGDCPSSSVRTADIGRQTEAPAAVPAVAEKESTSAAPAATDGLQDSRPAVSVSDLQAFTRVAQQGRVPLLLFDLVLLESWLSCAGSTADVQELPSHGEAAMQAGPSQAVSSAAEVVGRCAGAAAADIAGAVLAGLQQLLQEPQQQQATPEQQQHTVGPCVDEVMDQLLAVLQALLALVQPVAEAATPFKSAGVISIVVSCLELLVSAAHLGTGHKVAAVQLLSQLLTPAALQHPSARDSSIVLNSTPALQPVLSVLWCAAASAASEVRAAATQSAGQAAAAALQSMQGPLEDHTAAAASTLLESCVQLLAARTADVNEGVASAAQAHMTQLVLPLYLLAACSSTISTSSSTSSRISTGQVSGSSSVDTAAASASGMGERWKRLAALQPQQRLFKAFQLAQLFDVSFHASPAMLQRYSHRAAAQQQQPPPQDRYAAKTAALYRLAQSLPVLPAPGASGSNHSSGSSGDVLHFEDLSSAAVTSWLLTQEAARQCVGARMRTHLGNPTQSFGSLERVVQVLLQQLQGDGSSCAQQRAWQRQLLLQMQAATPQQQQQQQQGQQAVPGQQAEPQQLLQAPGASAGGGGGTSGAVRMSQSRPRLQQQVGGLGADARAAAAAGAAAGAEASVAGAEESRAEAEAAVCSLLDFMYALEVNMLTAIEGSLMRPPVSKSVMAFFAGNKKVCEDWFSRTRDSLLRLSAAVGAHQHVMFHGMARLTELHSQLKALTAHSQAQQQLLQQERERQKAQQQEGSAAAATAAAAAAAAISGLGAGPQQHQQQQERSRDRQQQQQGLGKASNNPEQRRLKGRQATAAPDADNIQQGSNGTAAAEAAAPPVSEQLRLLQQQYQAALLQLAGPVLSTLVLLADAAVAAGEPHVVLGLQRWAHQGFYAVWETVSQLYSLDILAATAAVPSHEEDLQDLDDYLQVGAGSDAVRGQGGSAAGSNTGRQQQQTAAPSMLLLSWLPGAAAQAAGRYEDALQLYGSFLASEACSTGLGGATKPWIQEQMAACYAALADWQGLGNLCITVRSPWQQQQQQQSLQQQSVQEPAAVPWLQHWQLAGVVGVQHLQSWCMPGAAHEQQSRASVQVIEQHLSGSGRGSRLGARGRGAEQGQHNGSVHSSSSEVLQQYRLDLQQSCGAASQAALAVLHATAALELCASSTEAVSTASSGSNGREGLRHVLQQGPDSPRGGAGRGRGRQGLLQPTAAAVAAAAQQQQELQQQLVLQAVTDLRQQLAALQSNPFIVLSGVCSVFDVSTSSLSTHSTLQQLSVMQLLQHQLAQSLKPGQQEQLGAQTDQVGHLLSCLALLSDRDIQSGSRSSCRSGSAVNSIWSDVLQQDGRLAGSLFDDVASTTALLQCLPGAGVAGSSTGSQVAKTVRLLLLREAMLVSSAHGCSSTLQRLLQVATVESSGSIVQEQQWLQLLSTKLQALPSVGATAAHRAVEAHLFVLQHDLDRLQELGGTSLSSSSSGAARGRSRDAASLAAAYLSLGGILQQAAQHSSWQEIQSMCPAFAQVNWHNVGAAAGHDVPQLAGSAGTSSTAANMGFLQDQPQQQAVLACIAAAVALRPHHPVPWKAYGDLLYELAGASAQGTAADGSAVAVGSALVQDCQGDAGMFGAAAQAYCQHLAACANTGALTSPQQSLGVLLKLLQIILQHGEQLQGQLSAALGTCPAAVWQVLTNQLLAQLQHSSAAVRALIQQLLQGLVVVVPCAVLYPLVVEVRAAQEAGSQVPDEVSAVVSQLQRVQQRMMADTVAMAEALEGLTVTRWEAWTGLLVELSLETNRKLLSLRADVSRQDQKHMAPARRMEVFMNRYNTMMTPVISSLQQHITAASANPPVSPDDAAFRQEMLPQLTALLDSLRQAPKDLLKLASGEQSDDEDSEGATDDSSPATAVDSVKQQQQTKAASASAAADTADKAVDSSGWPLLKQLRLQLQQHLRRQQHLQLAAVAPQLSKLRNTAIPLPADDLTDVMLPPLPLRSALERYATGATGPAAAAAGAGTGASALLAATGQITVGSATAAPGDADAASTAAAGDTNSSSWLCIAAFDKQVAVLPTKTRPKRLLLMASDGTVHAFLLKGRDDLRVDERLMQFIRASNALLSAEQDMLPAAAVSQSAQALAPASAAAAAVAGWLGSSKQPLRVRPYSITPFGRRAGLVQWVRHTTSLYGLFRSWQQCTAERYQAVAAGKRDAAAAAAAAAASAAAASGEGQQGERTGPAPTSDKAPDASAGASAPVQLPLIVAASRPTDAFYARLLPALQAAGLPVGSARSSWPASVLRSTFASLAREAPKSLLTRQLLSGAAEPGAWWSSQQAFTASAAAGSIVGWLLGLGDRHMDNLLLDRDSCELVHIDFSVCFDKGASLAVPEVVPFRLTQGMQVALGPGGLQGPFSAAAATVLSTLRSSADLLCGLLQLLLSDTAVDWSVDREAHAARKDQDTAVGLRLCASRLEELRHPLLANLAAALPTIGNGLAAVVSYGEAHLFMVQLQAQAAAAHARATAGSQTITDAAADEVRALTSGANAAKNVTALTADFRRLCGLAASCIQSAGSWLERHVETLYALGAGAGSSSSGSRLQSLLAARESDWDVAAADRPLLLLTGNAATAAAAGGSSDASGTQGLLLQALRSFLPSSGTAAVGDVASRPAADPQSLLPVELVQHCMQLDGQGVQLLQQQQELIMQGRWSLAAYAAVLTQLLSGGEAYIRFSHHWAWSAAFTAAAAGPDMQVVSTAAATAPQLPTHEQVAATWVCLAACWGAVCLVQQQHEAAVTASTAAVSAAGAAGVTAGSAYEASELSLSSHPAAGDPAEELSTALQQLSSKMQSSSAEVDAAEVQFVASTALAAACHAAQDAAAAAKAWALDPRGRLGAPKQREMQLQPAAVGPFAGTLRSLVPQELHALQLQLAALQTALVEYEQSGLAFILDPSASTLTHELPDADLGLEELLDAGDMDRAAALLAGEQSTGQQHWQQQLQAASSQLQLLPQLLTTLQCEALGPIAVWQAAADPALGSQTAGSVPQGASQQAGELQHQQPLQHNQALPLVLLPAGTISQQQLWHAAAAHIQQHWQQLQQLLQQSVELEGYMHALAAVAAAGGAASIWPEDVDLMPRAITLQQTLLPQGFDILTKDECVASAQLLQAQWADLQHRLRLTAEAALSPLLGLQQQQQAGMGFAAAAAGAQEQGAKLALLLEAAAASVSGGSILHCKDVVEALAAGDDGAGSGNGSSSSNLWGVPGVSDAWRCLVVLLLQYACLQQQLLLQSQQHQQQAEGLDLGTAAEVAAAEAGQYDVLRGANALPMEAEAHRPLLVAVQVLHELLFDSTQPGAGQILAAAAHTDPSTAAAPDQVVGESAAHQAVCLQQVLQDILLQPLVPLVLSVLQQPLQSLQQHLSTLAAESAAVLSRFQQPRSQQQQQHGSSEDRVDVEDSGPSAGLHLDAGTAGADHADLVPFDAFDESLPGADMLLEELGEGSDASHTGGDAGLGGLQDASAEGQTGTSAAAGALGEGLPELVPFDAFDEGLAGAGVSLEGDAGADLGQDGFFGALEDDDLLGGALEDEQTGLEDEQTAAQVSDSHSISAPAHVPDADAAAQELGQKLLAAGQHAGAAALQQQQLAALQQVEGTCAWQQQVWLRHLAAFEWLWGDLLPLQQQQQGVPEGQSAGDLVAQKQMLLDVAAKAMGWCVKAATAGGSNSSTGGEAAAAMPQQQGPAASTGLAVGPGAAYQLFCAQLLPQLPLQPSAPDEVDVLGSSNDSTGHSDSSPKQQRMPTGLQLLQSWRDLCEQQAAVGDALRSWQAGCASAAAAVGDVLLGAAGPAVIHLADPTVCRKMLSGAVARAGHWVEGATGLCSSLSQQAEAALQLEYSRRGSLWAPGMPDGVDAFQGNASLLQQMVAAATALNQSQADLAAAEALLAASQAAAAQAQVTIEESMAEAAAVEQQLVSKTPAALVRAQGMAPMLQPMVAAAEAALPFVTDSLGSTLRALVTLVERNSAARDLAPVVKAVCLQNGRCLRVLQRLHDIGAAAVTGLSSVMHDMQLWQQQQQGLPQELQEAAAAVLTPSSPAHDAQALQLLLAHMQPALAGVREELGELGQAHVLFTHLTEQLDSLAGAAETVAAAITSDHALQLPAAGQGRLMAAGSGTGSSSTGRKQRAEARQRAFAAAALARCTARLTGQRPALKPAANVEAPAAAAAQAGSSSTSNAAVSTPRSVPEEVSALVAAATSVDKLSRMYEGWAAWL